MSDWEESDSDTPFKNSRSRPPNPQLSAKKWAGEDEEDSGPAPATAPKKKGTLKAKLAQKELDRQARIDAGEDDDSDSDAVLDPREKARRDKERELNADLSNAADLLGAAALGGTSSSELDSLISAQPRTKDDFVQFSNQIIEIIIKRHQSKPLGLTTLANEKQKDQRDKASGKKKPKASGRVDTGMYDEALDDFGSNANDFM
ncbi:translation initiation factor eIF3 subunit [Mycena amicta]|nr:translation initiation factor eIF3 subunit [Mycena amicta]